MTEEELAEIEARANAAKPGPWRWEGDIDGHCPHGTEWTGHGPDLVTDADVPRRCLYCGVSPDAPRSDRKAGGCGRHQYGQDRSVLAAYGYDAWGTEVDPEDMAFIAHSREDVPLLLDHVAQLVEQLADRELEIRGLCRRFGVAGYPAEQMRALGRIEVEDTRGD